MKILFTTAVVLIVSALSAVNTYDGIKNIHLDSAWEDYKIRHQKNYPDVEDIIRRIIWEDNLQKVREHNLLYDLGHKSYTLGMNAYSDLTTEEFKMNFLGSPQQSETLPRRNTLSRLIYNDEDLPDEVDWRKKGFVTPVKNQMQGSATAYSATGSLEGQHFNKTGRLVSLSEQQLIDCCANYSNECLMDTAFRYVQRVGGIQSEKTYPSTERVESCKFDKRLIAATCSGYVDIQRGNEKALQMATATVGPISVAVDASHMSFQLYRYGVYDEPDCSSGSLDHAMLIVGYGVEQGRDYWLVKNSWGSSWGMNGYIMMSRNKNNQCGIASLASYPIA